MYFSAILTLWFATVTTETTRAFVVVSSSSKTHARPRVFANRDDLSFCRRRGATLLSAFDDGGGGGDDDDGFFDDYDEFVSGMNFENDDGWNRNNNDVGGRGGGRDDDYGGGGGGRGRERGGGRGRFRGGGGGRGGHDYERASDDDPNVYVDVEAVDRLLAERLTYKKTGRYDDADDVRDLLKEEYGVIIWDKDRVWTTNADRRGGSARHGANGRYGKREQRRDRQQRPRGPPRDFGPNGHDYEFAGVPNPSCVLDEGRVHELLAERLRCKLDRDFENADRIQDLLYDSGVLVHDGFKKWRVDGQTWGDGEGGSSSSSGGSGGSTGGGGRGRTVKYNRRGRANGLSLEDKEEVERLVAERARCKTVRDYETADEIRERLADEYDVYVDDKVKEWFLSEEGPPQGTKASRNGARDYEQRGPANGLSDEEKDGIVRLVAERSACKAARDYGAADEIRDRLAEEYDVVIDDRKQEWFLRTEEAESRHEVAKVYVRRGPARALSPEQRDEIASLVDQRAAAKVARDYDAADEIRERLSTGFDVEIDDARREFYVRNEEFRLAADSPLTPRVDVDVIGAELHRRAAARKEGDAAAADEIQDRLREEYGVVVHDVNKEYYVVDKGAEENDGVYDLELPPPDSKNGMGSYDEDEDEDDGWGSVEPAEKEEEEEEDLVVTGELDDDDDDDDDEKPVATGEEDDETLDAESRKAELSSLTVPVLKDRLREAGLPVSGRKAELVERLLQ